ncbi:hypothetical protein R3P38DRAFT_3199964 [Favolaschia claudopus]|uniref:F-box domain-containing protein n=1 Tax=Favolaschia claudopus TaxID=2862362 RepID=A0AAW0B2P2_9AGAR
MSANHLNTSIPVSEDVLAYLFVRVLVDLCGIDPFAHAQLRTVLQLVCRTWRRVIVAHPRLWYLIFIDANTSLGDLSLDLLRSGAVPLHIILDISELDRTRFLPMVFFNNIAHQLDAAMARCFRLTVQCEALVPYEAVFRWLSNFNSSSVQHITFDLYPGEDMTDAHFTSMPVLPFSLPSTLSVAHSLVLLGRVITPTNLTKLVLDSVGYDEDIIYASQLSDTLQTCVGLTHLHLLHLRTVDLPARTILEYRSCYLPTLTHLHVACSHVSCCYFVTTLDLPALTSLKFEGSGERLQCLVGDGRGHRNQGWGRVRVLTLVIDESPHAVACILPHFPLLRQLDLRSYQTSDVAAMWNGIYGFTQHEHRPFCAELVGIHLGCALRTDDVRVILCDRPSGHFASDCRLTSYVAGLPGVLDVRRYTATASTIVVDDCGSLIPDYLDFD